MCPKPKRSQKGFTLIELMVTIVVLVIALGIAVPNFTNQIRNNSSTSLGEEFVSALNFARSEAVKRGGRVSVCATNDNANCTNDWSDGWMAFVDGATSDTAALDVSEVLRVWDSPRNAVIDVEQGGSASNVIRYNGMGALARSGNAVIETKITGCSGDAARTIRITKGGAPSAVQSSCQ